MSTYRSQVESDSRPLGSAVPAQVVVMILGQGGKEVKERVVLIIIQSKFYEKSIYFLSFFFFL